MKKRVHSLFHRFGWVGALVALFVILNVVLGVFLFSSKQSYKEVDVFASKNLSFQDISNYLTEIANKKGALYAYEVLRQAPLPPNVDVHLLGHVVGDILYKQKGAKGILDCTQDFRNACSHTIVVGTLLEKGPSSFGEIADLCRQAPGGRGAYTMCFHGLGHGVLAYNDYELPKAVQMCEKAGKDAEYGECVGGTIMEMISGVHDRAVWEVKSKEYFKASDPLYPCDSSIIPASAKSFCYMYLTPHLFQAAGADLQSPDPATFSKAFSYCEAISGPNRLSCLSSFGKEFVVLAQNRDIRAIDTMNDDQFRLVMSWCGKSASKDGKDACVASSLNSIYWGGENNPLAAARFCNVADAEGEGKACTDAFLSAAAYFETDKGKRASICAALLPTYQDSCKKTLGV
jgi:hypothetical protein